MENCINAYASWKSIITNGLVEDCNAVKSKSDEYRISQDYIAQFIDEKIDANDPDGKIQKRELSAAFANWFQDTYSKNAPPAKELFTKFEKKFGPYNRIWRGCSIKEDKIDDDQFDDIE